MGNKTKYLLAVLVPVLILLSMTVLPLKTLLGGQEILLKTIPVDPTDLFRGDYVTLNYEISQVDIKKLPEELKKESYDHYGKIIYAVLKPEGKYYGVDHISLEKPKNGIFLKCRYEYLETKGEWGNDSVLHVGYYLDRHFVPENTGMKLEELSREGKLVAKIKVLGDYALVMDVLPE